MDRDQENQCLTEAVKAGTKHNAWVNYIPFINLWAATKTSSGKEAYDQCVGNLTPLETPAPDSPKVASRQK